MRIIFKKKIKVAVFGFCVLSSLFFNTVFAIEVTTKIPVGGDVELFFKLTCVNTFFNPKTVKVQVESEEGVGGQDVNLYHDEGGWFGQTWLGGSKVKVEGISQISSNSKDDRRGKGILSFSVKGLPEGTYYVGVLAGKNGQELKTQQAFTLNQGGSGFYAGSNITEYKFNLGDCDVVEKRIGVPSPESAKEKPTTIPVPANVSQVSDTSSGGQTNKKTVPFLVTCGAEGNKKPVAGAIIYIAYGPSGARSYDELKGLTTITESNGGGSLSVKEQDVESGIQNLRARYKGIIDLVVGSKSSDGELYTSTRKIAEIDQNNNFKFTSMADETFPLNFDQCPQDQVAVGQLDLGDEFKKRLEVFKNDWFTPVCNNEEIRIFSGLNLNVSDYGGLDQYQKIREQCVTDGVKCFENDWIYRTSDNLSDMGDILNNCANKAVKRMTNFLSYPKTVSQLNAWCAKGFTKSNQTDWPSMNDTNNDSEWKECRMKALSCPQKVLDDTNRDANVDDQRNSCLKDNSSNGPGGLFTIKINKICGETFEDKKKNDDCQTIARKHFDTEELSLTNSLNDAKEKVGKGLTGAAAVGSVGVGATDSQAGAQSENNAQVKQTPKEPVKTKIVAHVHGQDGGTITGIETKDGGRVAVGARVFLEDPEKCIIDNVSLEMQKTREADGRDILKAEDRKVEINRKREGQSEADKEIEGHPELYQNCQSYWANLKGPGTYQLIAFYPGYPEGHFEDNIHYLPSDRVVVEVIIKDSQASVKTISKVDAKASGGGTQSKAVKGVSNRRISWGVKGNVAGLQVEQGSNGLKVSPDKSSAAKLILTPKTTLSDGTLDTAKIPTVHFTVVEVLNDGSVRPIFDDANYPNNEPQVFDEAELGDLSRVIRLEATTSYNNPGSEYASSQGDLTIDVADPKDPAVAKIEEKPWVKLSSDPYKDNIFSGDSKVIVTASTNYAVEDPVFEVLHNGQNEDSKPVSVTTNCQDGTGSCEYLMELYQPDGEYSINFKNRGVLADEPLVFSTRSKAPEPSPSVESSPEEKIKNIELWYRGNKIWSSEEGSKWISPDLESGENVFELIFHYQGGRIVNKSFTVISEPEGSSPAPSSSFNPGASETPEASPEETSSPVRTPEPTEEPTIAPTEEPEPTPEETTPPAPECKEVRQYNECTGCHTSRRISQDSCGNYEVVVDSQYDGGCNSGCPEPTAEPQHNSLKWYCEGDVIMQEQNGHKSVYHDCSEEDESCRSKYTPGYDSDAECY